MSEKVTVNAKPISYSFVIFLVFLILKLCNVITWSWLWVTAPLWISFGIGLCIFIIISLIFIIGKILK